MKPEREKDREKRRDRLNIMRGILHFHMPFKS